MKRRKNYIKLLIVSALIIGLIYSIEKTQQKTSLKEEEMLLSVSGNNRNLSDEDAYIMSDGFNANQNMSIYVNVSRMNENGKDSFLMAVTARWLRKPLIRNEDILAVVWSGDFALVESSITAFYENAGFVANKTSMISAAPNSGVGYGVSCSENYVHSLKWVRIYAKISQIDRDGAANLVASYFHSDLNIFTKSAAISCLTEFVY